MNALDNAHIMDQQSSKGPASFAFPEAKSSQTGVSVNYAPSPDRKWYVLRTLYGHARQAADFLIVADYNEISSDSSSQCNVYLRKQPEGIQRVTMKTQQVDYLIEKVATDNQP